MRQLGARPARPARRQGPGERQARAGDRRGGRPQSADERAARRRQIDARGAPALDPAAALAEGAPRSLDDPFGGGADRRWRAHGPAALSARRIIRPRWPRSSAAACMRGRARCRSRITACSSSTNSRNSRRRCSTACASRSRRARSRSAAPITAIVYPARFQLVAAMNPCRCGHANDPGYACKRQPNERCLAQYQSRISGPLLDRIDLHIEVAGGDAGRSRAAAAPPKARPMSASASRRRASARRSATARSASRAP